MLQVTVDPLPFAPPGDGDLAAWTKMVRRVGSVISQAAVHGACSGSLRDKVIALWYSEQPEDSRFPGYEMARLAAETLGRLHDSPTFSRGAPLLDHVRCTPKYEADRLSQDERLALEENVAEAGCCKGEGNAHVGLLSSESAWSEPASHVLVEADIVARDDPAFGLVEPASAEVGIREFLPRSDSIDEVLARCCEFPSILIGYPEFAVEAFWVSVFGGSVDSLDFEVGSDFEASVQAMNYLNEEGLARTCLRVMTRIASGQAGEIEGHRERQGSGPSDPPLCDRHGVPVMRAYLANHTSDPHRLFWLRSERPKFLNVTGHEGRPAI